MLLVVLVKRTLAGTTNFLGLLIFDIGLLLDGAPSSLSSEECAIAHSQTENKIDAACKTQSDEDVPSLMPLVRLENAKTSILVGIATRKGGSD